MTSGGSSPTTKHHTWPGAGRRPHNCAGRRRGRCYCSIALRRRLQIGSARPCSAMVSDQATNEPHRAAPSCGQHALRTFPPGITAHTPRARGLRTTERAAAHSLQFGTYAFWTAGLLAALAVRPVPSCVITISRCVIDQAVHDVCSGQMAWTAPTGDDAGPDHQQGIRLDALPSTPIQARSADASRVASSVARVGPRLAERRRLLHCCPIRQ
jgi:hypothetical protein